MKIDSSSLVRALGSAFEGSVMAPYDAGWDVTRQAFNLDIDQRQALVAMPQSAEDVVAAVRFAAEHGLRVAPQAGGHNPVPLGDLSGRILLKTAEMNAFDVHAPARRTC